MKQIFVAIALALFVPSLTFSQANTVRVCTYNLLQFGDDDIDRADEFRLILNEISPSILVVQELASADSTKGYALFRDSVAALLQTPLVGLFHSDTTSGIQLGIFVDTAKLEILDFSWAKQQSVTRATTFASVLVKGTTDTLVVFGGHWKAGQGDDDESDRERAAGAISTLVQSIKSGQILRGRAVGRTNFIMAGDLNVYSASEEAYRVITDGFIPSFPGFHDPIDRPGDWNNNPAFADIHTQSTRTTQRGGGASGGLDDRFDQILVSDSLLDNVRAISYTAFGNDGNHFNDSINAMPNTAVSPEIAQALHDASDHLPVYVDFVFQRTTSVESAPSIDLRHLDLTVDHRLFPEASPQLAHLIQSGDEVNPTRCP